MVIFVKFTSIVLLLVKAVSTKFHKNPSNLTLNLLTTTIVAPPSNASKWQMGFNSAFKGLISHTKSRVRGRTVFLIWSAKSSLFRKNGPQNGHALSALIICRNGSKLYIYIYIYIYILK